MILHLFTLTIGMASVILGVGFIPEWWSGPMIIIGSATATLSIFNIFDARNKR